MINSFESFLEHLGIPDTCKLDKPVFKKLFLDKGALNATDKKCLKDDVNRVRWLYTLKPGTINIAPYSDTVREYPELNVIHIELRTPNRMARIAHFINRSIPYPLLLIFTMASENKTRIAFSLADKRTNRADKEKWVLEDTVHSVWIDLTDQSRQESKFLKSLKITALPYTDFLQFYQALMGRVIAINCVSHSGVFTLNVEEKQGQYNVRLKNLRELERLYIQRSELTSKLKKERQMGGRIELNTEIKKINERVAEIKGSL